LIRSLQLILSALSAFRPAILVLEDLHWADGASVEVMAEALTAIGDRKALVLATHRPTWTAPWAGREENEILALAPLGDGDAVGLARSILGGAELEPELELQVTERAGGNPFFVEELLRSLQETEALQVRDGRIGLVSGAADKLPSTLTELLLARLDQLDRASRSTAQHGSVIGRSFAVPLLARIVEGDETTLRAPLQTLERAEIAFPRQSGEDEYVFKHATVREVAYNTLLLRRRQSLHAATARAIIDLYPVEDHVDVIAYHYEKTREHEAAAEWLERSADRAAAAFANDVAIERYGETRRRQDLVGAAPGARARVDEKLGHILRVVGRYEEALKALDAAVEGYRESGNAESVRRVTAEIGRVHRAQGTADEGIARIKQVLDADPHSAPSSGVAALYVVLARLYFNVGKYQEDFDAASRGAELANLAADTRTLAEAEMVRGGALYYLRRIQDALQAMEAAIPLAEEAGDLEVLSILLGNTSVIYRDAGELERSLEHQERSAHITDQTGDFANHAFALMCMGEITFLLGEWDRAETYLERSRALVGSLGPSWFSSHPVLQLGRIKMARGDFDAAAALIDEGLSIAAGGNSHQAIILGNIFLAEMELLQDRPQAAVERLSEFLGPEDMEKDDSTLSVALLFLAWAHLECGNLDEAELYAQLAVTRLTEENAVTELLLAQRVAGMVSAAQGRRERAEATFEETVALARKVRFVQAEACILYEYGMTRLREGRREDALPLLEESLRLFRELGAHPYVERAERELLSV
jgi:tetratricopeptide (TPR) repeat protein